MVKSAIRSIPRELPHASIYLDDLFEIEQILSERFSKLPNLPEFSFQYEVEGSLRMTTHQDLIDHGGSCTSFRLGIVSVESSYSENCVLRFYGRLRPTFDVPYVLKEEGWAIWGKVEQIFRTRAGKLKALATSLPQDFIYGAYVALCIIGFIAGLQFRSYHGFIGLIGLALICVSVQILVSARNWNNKIFLHYRREREKSREAVRREWFGKLAVLVLGAVLGVVGTILMDYFNHPN